MILLYLVTVVAGLALAHLWMYVLTCGVQWVVHGVGQATLPFWPVYIGILLFNIIVGGAVRSTRAKR